jgi:hypothetical protein
MVDQDQLSAASKALSYIANGYERATMRAANYAAARTKTETTKQLMKLITADPNRIKDSVNVRRATLSKPAAVLDIYGKAITLFRFDVSFMYPTVTGGVKANIFKAGGSPLQLDHAFIAKVKSGSDQNPGPNHWGVFSRRGPPRRMTRGNYIGQVKQPLVQHFGPTSAKVIEKTPGVQQKIMEFGAAKFVQELDRQVGLLFKQEYGIDPPEDFF